MALLIALAGPLGAQTLPLTPEEQRWLDSRPLVRLGPAPNFPPVEFFDAQGAYRGLTADVMRIVEQRTGLRFEVVRCESWQEVLDRTERLEIDAWAEAAVTPARAERMDFTRPYIELPTAILGRDDRVGGVSLASLREERVVVVRGYATHDYLQQELPGLQPILVPDLETGLRLLSFGGADSMVASLAPASYYIQRLGITNLRVIGEADFSWKLAFASRRGLPHLRGIVQKALDTIPPARMQELRQRWLTLEPQPWRPSPLQVLAALASLALLLASSALWINAQLRRRIEASTADLQRSQRALQTLLDAVPMALFAVDAEGRVVETNARSRQLFAPGEDPKDRLTSSSIHGRLLVELLFPGHPTALDGLLRDALAGTPQRCEREARLPDGSPLDLELSLEAVTLGEMPVVLVSARDLSDQRRLGRMQSEFLSTVTHELRTPLTSIYGSLRLLEALPLDAEESRDLVRVATRNGERLLQLVDDVIDVERLNRGQLPFELA
ncbi:MAG TPA: hypothetical protein DEA08_24275, partial [Planctomycetes bacterium]|nr:hypothetical protein [Planctomycetota bacterium]